MKLLQDMFHGLKLLQDMYRAWQRSSGLDAVVSSCTVTSGKVAGLSKANVLPVEHTQFVLIRVYCSSDILIQMHVCVRESTVALYTV